MKPTVVLLLLLAFLVSLGCTAGVASMKRGFAVGNVPCREADIEADDTAPDSSSMASSSFEVGCAGSRYVCSRTCTSYSGLMCSNATTHCMELAAKKATARVTTATTSQCPYLSGCN